MGDRPKLDLYCLCWNEARIIPFFLRHYLPLADRIIVFDNGSTDQSLALLSGDERIKVTHFDVTGNSFVDEERRLMYVGITRAKDRAFLTYARHRMLFGRTSDNPPSRFLGELPTEGVELRGTIETEERDQWAELDWDRDRARYEERKEARRETALAGLSGAWTGRATREAPRKRETPSETRFRAGDHVRHPSLGSGVVVSSTLRSDDEEVTVAFPEKGVKKLMASFAKLAKA